MLAPAASRDLPAFPLRREGRPPLVRITRLRVGSLSLRPVTPPPPPVVDVETLGPRDRPRKLSPSCSPERAIGEAGLSPADPRAVPAYRRSSGSESPCPATELHNYFASP